MASRVKEFTFGVRRGNPKYPWDKWCDGSAWKVTHGKDFTCTPGSLVVYLYHKARELDMAVRTSIVKGTGRKPDRVVFQFRQRATEVTSHKKRRLKRKKDTDAGRQDQGRQSRFTGQAEEGAEVQLAG